MTSPQRDTAGAMRLSLNGISKHYPGCKANDKVNLQVLPGEIHALLGENGAGKSTLVKIIYGVLQADEGQIHWNDQAVAIKSPSAARKLGIGMVFQHFTLFEAMTVTENIALGLDEERDMSALEQRIRDVSESYGLPLDPRRYVHTLSVGERQRIEIVRCLLQNPQLLIMDEPTSVLTPQEANKLFETLRRLAKEGVSILYISHKLDEIQQLCDHATIMRGGKVVDEVVPKNETARSMAHAMIGDEVTLPEHKTVNQAGDVVLNVHQLSLHSTEQFGVDLNQIDFDVRAGEILGIAGVAGNGQIEMLSALSGETLTAAESIFIKDAAVGQLGPRRRRMLGLNFVPEERLGHGSVPDMDLVDNTILSAYRKMNLLSYGLLQMQKAKQFAQRICDQFRVVSNGIHSNAASLSGGNLQKFIIGREILQQPKLLIAAHPTWGVDAGAAAAIHQALIDLAANGAAVLVVSQDLDELFAISHRIAVISEGHLSEPTPTSNVTLDEIGLLMGGLTSDQDDDQKEALKDVA